MPADTAPSVGPGRHPWWQAMLTSAVVWSGISIVHAGAIFNDRVRSGEAVAFADVVLRLVPAYLPWAIFSTVLYLLLPQRAASPVSGRRLGGALAVATAAFYIPQSLYQVALDLWRRGAPWSSFGEAVRQWSMVYWLIDAALFLATFSAVAALVHMRQARVAESRRQRLLEENLRLRLQVSEQRLATLRAQLQPHFLFNTLNAIAALVRSGNPPLALDAVHRLSALLRHAIGTAEVEWVTLREEWGFVGEYLALQQLRYGVRLQVQLEPLPDSLMETPIPPLLLQPLVENAVRHDAECHDATCVIGVVARTAGNGLMIEITNTLQADATPNPGSGVGLRATRDRLMLIYGPAATLELVRKDDRFTVRVVMPSDGDA